MISVFCLFLLLGVCKGCFISKTDWTSCLTSCWLDVLMHWNSATSWDTFFYHSSKHYECSPLWWMHLKSWFSLHPNAHWPNMWVKANLLLTTAGTQTETAIQMSCRLVCHESEPSLGHLNRIKRHVRKLPCSSHNILTTSRLNTLTHTHTHTYIPSSCLYTQKYKCCPCGYPIEFHLFSKNPEYTTTSQTLHSLRSFCPDGKLSC